MESSWLATALVTALPDSKCNPEVSHESQLSILNLCL